MNVRTNPRDVLLHLASALLLYVSVGALFALLFQYIDVLVPDALNPSLISVGAFAFPLASFIVAFPLYLWTMHVLYRDRRRNAESSGIGIRKWFIYITIFLAAALMVGDFIALLSSFLRGEFSVRFLLKAAAFLAVASSVFGYYLYELRRQAREYARTAKLFLWCVCGIALAIITMGFLLGGSPFAQRELRFDIQRVGDLQMLQNQIVNYWTDKRLLPPSLDVLRDDMSGFVPPFDPQTGAAYEYRTTGPQSFELCALFQASSLPNTRVVPMFIPGYGDNNSWAHASGRVCFSRTVDSKIYLRVPITK